MTVQRRVAERLADGRLTVTRLADGSGVVLDVEGLTVLSLNETGMFLLDAIRDGATTSQALASRLVGAFEVDPETARRDVEAFLAELARGLS